MTLLSEIRMFRLKFCLWNQLSCLSSKWCLSLCFSLGYILLIEMNVIYTLASLELTYLKLWYFLCHWLFIFVLCWIICFSYVLYVGFMSVELCYSCSFLSSYLGVFPICYLSNKKEMSPDNGHTNRFGCTGFLHESGMVFRPVWFLFLSKDVVYIWEISRPIHFYPAFFFI